MNFFKRQDNFYFCKSPLLAAFLKADVSSSDVFYFFKAMYASSISYFRLVRTFPAGSLLYLDYAEAVIADFLSYNSAISSIVLTNTNWFSQKLWMSSLKRKRHLLHMTLYSVNNIPFASLDNNLDPLDNKSVYPGIELICVDVIHSWMPEYDFALRKLGVKCSVRRSEPILWYSSSEIVSKSADAFVIQIFDVPPFRKEVIGSLVSWEDYYYKYDLVEKFLEDIICVAGEVAQSLNVKIFVHLKTKRDNQPSYDPRYFSFLEALKVRGDYFDHEGSHANVFDLIARANLVINIPFTSTHFVASFNNVPSIYYDPSRRFSIKPHLPHIKLINNEDDLTSLFENVLMKFSEKL